MMNRSVYLSVKLKYFCGCFLNYKNNNAIHNHNKMMNAAFETENEWKEIPLKRNYTRYGITSKPLQGTNVQAQALAGSHAPKANAVVPTEQGPTVQTQTPKKSWASLASKKLETAPPAPHKVKEVLLGIKTPIKKPEIYVEEDNDNDEYDEEEFDFQPIDDNIYNKPNNRAWSEMYDDEYDEN